MNTAIHNVGDHVMVFDQLRYKDDRNTPLSVTMQPATIDRLYTLDDGCPVADVRFDHNGGRLSRAHFLWAIYPIVS